jgi:hypothetical protein
MAGTIPISMTQQFDIYGQPLAGGQLYIIQAGTVSTPQDAFQDTALTIKQPYPMTLDAAGRVPQFFLADGTVKIRLQDKNGVVQLAADSVMVIGASSGGGGGGTIDPTTIYQTGDMKARYGTGAHAGWIRGNALTIGSATSGATERANADCQALFQHLWGADSTLAVSGGRGASAVADWTANKTITTPDYRGYALSGLDDMGNLPANRLGSFANATTLGSAGGVASTTLLVGNLPPHTHGINQNTGNSSANHNHAITTPTSVNATASAVSASGGNLWFGVTGSSTGSQSADHTHNLNTSTDTGSGTVGSAFLTIGPRKLCTIYLKL